MYKAYDGMVDASYGDVILVSLNYRISALGLIPLDIPGQTPGRFICTTFNTLRYQGKHQVGSSALGLIPLDIRTNTIGRFIYTEVYIIRYVDKHQVGS